MYNWPQRMADWLDLVRRLLHPRRSNPALTRPGSPARPRLGLEPLAARILLNANVSFGPDVLAYKPDAATASPVAGMPDAVVRYDLFPSGAGEKPAARSGDTPAMRQVEAGDITRYDPHDMWADHEMQAAGLYVLLADYRGNESRHELLPSSDRAAPQPSVDAAASAPSQAARDATASPRESASERRSALYGTYRSGIADDLAEGEADVSSGRPGEIDGGDLGRPLDSLLVVDWASPDPREELTPLNRANLAFVPTYVVNDARPIAAPPTPAAVAADLALAGVVVGPELLPQAAPVLADLSTGGGNVVDHLFQACPLPAGDPCSHMAARLRFMAVEFGQWLADLPQPSDASKAAAVGLVEVLVVLGAWRLTESDDRPAQ
jgi:hypothetical protein